MGQGHKSEYDGTFLTDRAIYRRTITAADPDGPDGADHDGAAIPVVPLHYDPTTGVRREDGAGTDYQLSVRAYNSQLMLTALLTKPEGGCLDVVGLIDGVINPEIDERCQAIIRVWAWCGEGVPGVDDLETVLVGFWALYYEQSVLCDTLIPLRNVPATPYKVTVDYLSADCSVTLLEQHTV